MSFDKCIYSRNYQNKQDISSILESSFQPFPSQSLVTSPNKQTNKQNPVAPSVLISIIMD